MTRVQAQGTEIDKCRFCAGTFFDAGEAREVLGEGTEAAQWKDLWVTSPAEISKLPCPVDRQSMATYRLQYEGEQVEVDHCHCCGGLWLDRNEAELLARISQNARAEKERHTSGEKRPGWKSYFFQLATQFPMEVWHPVKTRPALVYALLSVLPLIFLVQLTFAEQIAEQRGMWMMVPKQVFAGIHQHTILTNGFLHGSLGHIFGNLYFLWLFGDNVEDTLGRKRFAIIYLLSLLAGSLTHAFAFSTSPIPVLGASGAVAGLMGAYLVLFPRVQVWIVLLFFRFRMPARWYLGLWLVFQMLMQVIGSHGVAWLAHVGGFVTGAVIAAWFASQRNASRT